MVIARDAETVVEDATEAEAGIGIIIGMIEVRVTIAVTVTDVMTVPAGPINIATTSLKVDEFQQVISEMATLVASHAAVLRMEQLLARTPMFLATLKSTRTTNRSPPDPISILHVTIRKTIVPLPTVNQFAPPPKTSAVPKR